eukprot:3250452-Rhodomonas_salina.1
MSAPAREHVQAEKADKESEKKTAKTKANRSAPPRTTPPLKQQHQDHEEQQHTSTPTTPTPPPTRTGRRARSSEHGPSAASWRVTRPSSALLKAARNCSRVSTSARPRAWWCSRPPRLLAPTPARPRTSSGGG